MNRHLMAIMILAGLILAVVPSRAEAVTATVSRNINDYVLFAIEELDFKGRNANDSRGFILGGNVGVNGLDSTPNNSSRLLSMGGASAVVIMDPGTQVVADSMKLSTKASVYDVFANYVPASFNPIINNSGPTAFTAPIIVDLPDLPSFNPDLANHITVEKDQTLVLPPGRYGDVRVKDGGTLILANGVYDVRNFINGKKVSIQTQDGTIVQVQGAFGTNNDSYIGGSNLAQFLVGSVDVKSNDFSISFGRRTEAHGLFYAPNGHLALGHTTDLFGHFWANTIGSDFNVNINDPRDVGNEPPGEEIPEPAALTLCLLAGASLITRRRR